MGYVYKITNTVNRKSYIGISINEPEKGRIRKHLTGRGNRILANAVKKYGRDAFVCEILKENIFPDLLPDLEVAYIAKYNTVRPNGYNLTYGGHHGTHSEETCEKISRANRGKPSPLKGKPLSQDHCEKISRSLRGRSFSKDHRENLSRAQQGRSTSQETREKISLTSRGRYHSQETREKISQNLQSPDKEPAQELFFSFPITMPLSEKRKILRKKFPERGQTTIYRWVREWEDEKI